MAKGTFEDAGRGVRARSVLPEPVGPMSRMLLLSSFHFGLFLVGVEEALVVVVHGDGEGLLGLVLADDGTGRGTLSWCAARAPW